MAAPANPMMNVYRAQLAGTRQIVDATLAGLDRLERLTMRTLREAASDQFQFAQTVSRSLGSANGEDLATLQSEVTEPATQRLARCQRDLWVALAEMNGAVATACGGLVQGMNNALAESGASLGTVAPQDGQSVPEGAVAGNPWAWYENALRQWQTMGQQVVDASRPIASAAETTAVEPPARDAARRKARS